MAQENLSNFFPDMKSIIPEITSSLYTQFGDKISTVFTLTKILLIVSIIYFIILIISKLYRIRDSKNLNKIAINTIQINEKIDLLLNSKKKQKKN